MDTDDTGARFAVGDSPFHAKGMLWLGVSQYLDHAVDGGVAAVVATLDPPYREFLTQMFLATGWYDVMPILAVAKVAAGLMRIDPLEYIRRSAQWHAEQDMAGVHKVLLRSATPVAVCRRFASIHQLMYDFGKVEILREEPHKVHACATGIPEPLAWWWRRASECYMHPILRGTGAKQPRLIWLPNEPDGKRAGVSLLRIPSYTVWSD